MVDETTPDAVELAILRNSIEERKCSDEKYAIKLVERVVWGLIGLILTGFFLGLLSLLWKG